MDDDKEKFFRWIQYFAYAYTGKIASHCVNKDWRNLHERNINDVDE